MEINLNGRSIRTEELDMLLSRGAERVYMIDENDEYYWDLDSALSAAEALKDTWAGDLNVCKYTVNVAYSEAEGYHLIDETAGPLEFTGDYWIVHNEEPGEEPKTLRYLTGNESGIIIYEGNTVAALNWSDMDYNQLPYQSPFGIFGFPGEDGLFAGAIETHVDDYRTILPGSIWYTGETDEDGNRVADTDLDIVDDPNDDLLRAFLTPDDPALGGDFSADVYTLKTGEIIIAPGWWA